MEVFIIIAMSLGLFISGVSLGAYLENKRLHSISIIREVNRSLEATQQILIPLAEKITHFDTRQRQFINRTLVDYNNMRDLELTLEMPIYERESVTEELNLKEEQWLKKQKNWED